MVTDARPLEPTEYQAHTYIDPSEVDALMGTSREDIERSIRPLARKTDRVIVYHPDPNNPSSVAIVPMNPEERRFRIQRLLSKTVLRDGKAVRWNYPTPQVEAIALPLRCFIQGCERAGGFQNRAQLIAHVQGKHSNEAPLYQRLIDALMDQIYKDIPAEQYEMYGLTPPETDGAVAPVRNARAGRSKAATE